MKNSLRLIVLAIMSLAILNVSATERLTAVLQHNGTPSAFYGDSAFIQAVEAAEPGDLITLSAGVFLPHKNITKALKIQGQGIKTQIDGGNDRYSNSHLNFNIPKEQESLVLEGIKFCNSVSNFGALNSAKIRRCTFLYNLRLTDNESATVSDCEISQCNFTEKIGQVAYGVIYCDKNTSNLYIHNCLLHGDQIKTDAVIDRCVIMGLADGSNHSIKNSIFKTQSTDLVTTMRYINVLYYTTSAIKEPLYKENMIELSNDELNALFKSTDTYELTDEAAAKYVFDGSQIGAYGGSTPYTLVPAIPQITSATVPSTVSADGQMQISFTVEAHE